MLGLAIRQQRRQDLWQAYTATALSMIGKALAGESWTLQSYVEMAYQDKINLDTRSAAQIVEDIKKRFTE